MTSTANIDINAAHRYFSAECFNRAWDLMDKTGRTPEEEEQMLRLSMASTWHWSQRPDCTPVNISIGYWQISRIYTLLQQADNARHYGRLCLESIQGKDAPPFYYGYAYEALARAEAISGNKLEMEGFLSQARQYAEKMTDLGSKQQLLSDLDMIR